MDLAPNIAVYLRDCGRFESVGQIDLVDLDGPVRGCRFSADGRELVLRLDQSVRPDGESRPADCEYRALKAVAPSGVTPRPLFYDPDPPSLPGGVLVREFIPGRRLDYATDLDGAARTLARIHALPPDPDLIIRPEPEEDLIREGNRLLEGKPDQPRPDPPRADPPRPGFPRQEVRDRLLHFRDHLLNLCEKSKGLYSNQPLTIVNAEVGASDFMVNQTGVYLTEWTKAVVSSRCLDLARFIAPTNTKWTGPVELSRSDKDWFLTAYGRESAHLASPAPSVEELFAEVDLLERAVIFRDLAKCYSAYCRAVQSGRPIRNQAVLSKVKTYLDDSDQWLAIDGNN